jgi:hypothetical protein
VFGMLDPLVAARRISRGLKQVGPQGLEHATRMGVRRLAQCDPGALPFASGSFVLAPGGLHAIRVSVLNVLRSRHSEFAQECQRFTRQRLVKSVTAEGLRVIRCTYANSLLLPLALAKFRLWEPLFRKQAASGITPVSTWHDRALHAPLAFELRMITKGWNFSAGQSLIVIAEKGSGLKQISSETIK